MGQYAAVCVLMCMMIVSTVTLLLFIRPLLITCTIILCPKFLFCTLKENEFIDTCTCIPKLNAPICIHNNEKKIKLLFGNAPISKLIRLKIIAKDQVNGIDVDTENCAN